MRILLVEDERDMASWLMRALAQSGFVPDHAADARTVLHSAVDAGRGDLVLDLTELDSWDATGLGVIMGAHRRAGRANRRLVLRGVPPQMERLLVATRLHRILTIER